MICSLLGAGGGGRERWGEGGRDGERERERPVDQLPLLHALTRD